MEENYVKQANHVSVVSLIANVALSALKLVVGFLAGSSAMISDAVHSMSDCFSTVVVMIGIRMAGKNADKEHPYGHERLECIAALVLSAMLFGTALLIGYKAAVALIAMLGGATSEKEPFLWLALGAALLSIVVKFLLYVYTERRAKQLSSTALHGDALHHLGDSLSSVGSFIGIGGAMLGFAFLDPVASLVICCMIGKSAYDICAIAVDQLVDKAADEETEEKIRSLVNGVEGVKRIDVLRTRIYGNRIFAEIEIAVDAELSLVNAHRIAEKAHALIEKEIAEVKHCMIHVNPMMSCGFEPDNHEDPKEEWV